MNRAGNLCRRQDVSVDRIDSPVRSERPSETGFWGGKLSDERFIQARTHIAAMGQDGTSPSELSRVHHLRQTNLGTSSVDWTAEVGTASGEGYQNR